MKKIISILMMMWIGLFVFGQDDTLTLNGKANPTASISGYYHICANGTADIPVYLTNGPVWDVTFSDGFTQWTVTGITSSPYHLLVSPASVTTYQVANVVAGGCSGTGTGAATVIIDPEPTIFTLSCSNTSFCQGGFSGTLTLNGSTSGDMYYLLINGDTVAGSMMVGTGTMLTWPGLNTAGTVQAIAENPTGCSSVMNGSIMLTMNPLPNNAGPISGLATVCQNETATYTTGAVVNATGYTWAVPTGATILTGQGTTAITVDFSNAVSGNISVFPTNSCGAGNPSQFAVTVNASPTLVVTTSASDICEGGSAILTASGGTTYVWSNGANTATTTVVPVTPTTTYMVTATSTNGCTASGSVTINTHPADVVTLNLSPASACTDVNIVTLSGGYPAGGTYTGNCVIGTNTVYPPITGQGTYIITYTYTNQWGCTATAQQNFAIYNPPSVVFGPIDSANQITIATPPFMLTTGTPSGGVYSGPGVTLIGSNYWLDPAAAGPGTFAYSYVYTHPITGCDAGDLQWVTIGTVGIDEITADVNNIILFPNPASNVLNLQGINTKNIKLLTVMDLVGQVVYTSDIASETMKIDVSSYPAGTYIISFMDADGVSVSKMFMKAE